MAISTMTVFLGKSNATTFESNSNQKVTYKALATRFQ